MPNPICEKCRPNNAPSNVYGDGVCSSQYELVESCMKLKNGNIASCKEQRSNFKVCFDNEKSKNGDVI